MLKDKIKYKINNIFTSGNLGLLAGLAIITGVLILIITVFCYQLSLVPLSPSEQQPFFKTFWMIFMCVFDPGGVESAADGGWLLIVTSIVSAIAGLILIGALVAILDEALTKKIESLKKGKSLIVESDHIIILGWSKQIFNILIELSESNQNCRKKLIVVILADKDKSEMDDLISENIDKKNLKILCRTGESINQKDLEMVSLNTAKSIIICGDEGDRHLNDSYCIKTCLAIVKGANRKKGRYHIVANVNSKDSSSILTEISSDEIIPIFTDETISKIIAQASMQQGLAETYMKIFSFKGDSVYFLDAKKLGVIGLTYAEVLPFFANISIIGIKPKDGNGMYLNSDRNKVIKDCDELVVLAPYDSIVNIEQTNAISNLKYNKISTSQNLPTEDTLIIGWNEKGKYILKELSEYLDKSSKIKIVADKSYANEISKDNIPFETIEVVNAKTTSEIQLINIEPCQYRNIILLSYCDKLTTQEADSVTIETLIYLQKLTSHKDICITIEILDAKNKDLAKSIIDKDDFIISNQFISMIMSQLAIDKKRAKVFEELVGPNGSIISLKNLSEFEFELERDDIKLSMVIQQVIANDKSFLGFYKSNTETIYLNPNKNTKHILSKDDKVIVLG